MISSHILISVLLLGFFGCASLDRHVAQPVKPLFPVELKGPYDRDIPDIFVAMLKDAFAKHREALPYLFTAIGIHFEMGGDDIRSIHFYDRAQEAFSERKQASGAEWAATRKIKVLSEHGRIKEAERVAGDREGAKRTLTIKAFADYADGCLFLTNGNYQEALRSFTQAIDNNLAYRESLEFFILRRDTEFGAAKALIYAYYIPRLSKKTGWIEASKVISRADKQRIDQGIGHLKRALELHEDIQRLEIANFLPQMHSTMVEANVCNFIGLAEGLTGNASSADYYLKRSLGLSQMAGNPIGEAASLFFLNQIYRSGKNAEAGLKTAQLLNVLAERHGLRFYQMWSAYLLAQYYMDKGNISDALASLQSVVIFLERPGWMSEATGIPYFLFNPRTVYELMLTLRARQGDARGCLEIADRVKSREMNDLVAGENMGANEAETALIEEGRRVAADVLDIQRKMLRCADRTAVGRLMEKMRRAEMDYDHILSRIQQVNPALHALISVQNADSAAIQERLDENTTLFSYFVADSHLYVWVMNRGRLHLERFDMAREDLQHLVLSFFDAVRMDDKARVKALSSVVYDTLLKPVMMFVSGDRLGIVAHDVLHYLPFAASSYRGKYLAEGFSIFYLPHLSALKNTVVKKNTKGMKILVYGNPVKSVNGVNNLYSEMDPARIKKRLPGTEVIMGDPAAIAKIKAQIDDYDMIHFAAKWDYRPADLLNSALFWLPNGQNGSRLTVASIFKLRMTGRAVLLSATETKPDLQSTGADILLLNQAFLYAGRQAVLSSLWPVGGMMKVRFLDSFYASLEKKNDLAESLQHAQSEWIRKGYAPYAWAPFKLMGN